MKSGNNKCLGISFFSQMCYTVSVSLRQEGVQDSQTTQAEDEESAFFLLFMGGGLLIILFAVISAMSTVSGAISIAVNMDVDGE